MIKRNAEYKPRIASEKYGTSVMKDEECLLFVEAVIENGTDVKTAIADMRMIDDLLFMKNLHLAVFGTLKHTSSGHLRKRTSIYDAFNDIISS